MSNAEKWHLITVHKSHSFGETERATNNNSDREDGEISQWLNAPNVYATDHSSIPSTHVRQLITACNSRDSDTSGI